jgi:hypothetical protein
MSIFEKKYKVAELAIGEVYKINKDSGKTELAWTTIIYAGDFSKEKYSDIFGRRIYNEAAQKTPTVYFYMEGCMPFKYNKKTITRDEAIDFLNGGKSEDLTTTVFGVTEDMKNLNE